MLLLSTLWRFGALHSYYLAGLFASVLFLVPSIRFPGIHHSEFKSRKTRAAWKSSAAFRAQKDMPVGSQIYRAFPSKGLKAGDSKAGKTQSQSFHHLMMAERMFPSQLNHAQLSWGSSPLIPGRELQTPVSPTYLRRGGRERDTEEKS